MPIKAVSALQKNAAANRETKNNIIYKLLMLSISNPADYATGQFHTIIASSLRSVKEIAAVTCFAFPNRKQYHHF